MCSINHELGGSITRPNLKLYDANVHSQDVFGLVRIRYDNVAAQLSQITYTVFFMWCEAHKS